MKISVIGEDNFIKKNLVENLKTISDGRNRTRTDMSVSAVIDGEGGDTLIILPSEKHNAEEILKRSDTGKAVVIGYDDSFKSLTGLKKEGDLICYRAPLIAGKWDETDSLIQRFCKAAAEEQPFPDFKSGEVIEILFIEDLTEEVLDALEGHPRGRDGEFPLTYKVTLDSVKEELLSYGKLQSSLFIHEIPEGSFSYKLFSLYLSFLPENRISYPVNMNIDNRGVFSELIKTGSNGQVSINIAKPGVTRGQHWHNTKWEIFIVVSGHGLIEEREIGSDRVISFDVRGEDMRAVIMLPGYTHSITNLEKDRDLVTVMFANEPFDPAKPDTFFEEV